MNRVLLVDPIAPAGERVLGRAVEVLRAGDSDPAAPRLRAVAIHGTGSDLVPLAEASPRGVMVSNVPGGNAQSVAEYCAMAMLMLARNVLAITQALREGTWDAARALGAGSHEIAAMTVGIIGVGHIGTRLARICRHGLGMRVLGNQRRLERLPAEAQACGLEALLHGSDFVVATCPLTAQTRHLLNRRTLSAMKPSAWLINVGRGPVVEEEALVEALSARRIAGAMLDVYEHYRLAPGHPLLGLDNVILTPHLAGMTVESLSRVSVAAAEEMLRMLAGERPRNLVNLEALPARRG